MLQARNSIHRQFVQYLRYYSSSTNTNSDRVVLESISSASSNQSLFRKDPLQQNATPSSTNQNTSKLPNFPTQNELEKYNLMPNTSDITITGYIGPGFMINNVRVFGSIIAHPKQVFVWNVKSFEELTTDSLKLLELLSPIPDLLIIGTGERHEKIPVEFIRYFMEKGIQVDYMKTTSAISTWNVLNQEGRNVVCAAISLEPVDPRTLTPQENPALFLQLQDSTKEL